MLKHYILEADVQELQSLYTPLKSDFIWEAAPDAVRSEEINEATHYVFIWASPNSFLMKEHGITAVYTEDRAGLH